MLFELSLEKFVLVGYAEMLNLVENVAEIAKITNYRGRSIANGDVCLEKTYLLLVTRRYDSIQTR